MSKQDRNLVKAAQDFLCAFIESHKDIFVFHDFRFVNETVNSCKEIGKTEAVNKEDYEIGVTALILSELSSQPLDNNDMHNETLVARFIAENHLSEREVKELQYYVDFFTNGKLPQNHIEEVLRDGKDLFLAMPDALERLSLLRIELERAGHKTYSDIEWLQFCKGYFITHTFFTRSANRKYGTQRSKNYFELERHIDKVNAELTKEKKGHDRTSGDVLLDKESEDLFKIAFRNYLNLVELADRKANLLIQVNSILASVIIGFVAKNVESLHSMIIPVAAVLIVAAITIFYGILASKPLNQSSLKDVTYEREPFFFGSFDKLDPGFKHVTIDKYSGDMLELFRGDKKFVFDELIKESFLVRKVLSKKFGYLDIAYKVFFAGLLFIILSFLFVMIFKPFG